MLTYYIHQHSVTFTDGTNFRSILLTDNRDPVWRTPSRRLNIVRCILEMDCDDAEARAAVAVARDELMDRGMLDDETE